MSAKEVREYRAVSKRLVEVEERSRLLEKLISRKVGLAEEEGFVLKELEKYRNTGRVSKIKSMQRQEMISTTNKYKLKDNNIFGDKLRKKRNWLRGTIERAMGGRSREYRKLIEETKTRGDEHRKKLKLKYRQKVDHLEKKFGSRWTNKGEDELDGDMLDSIGVVTILTKDGGKLAPEKLRDPVVVEGEGEVIVLSPDERDLMTLGPKYCVYSTLNEEEFTAEVEECIMKIRWDIMGDEDGDEGRGLEDIALEVLLGKDECEMIDEEKKEETELIEAGRRQPYDRVGRNFSFGRKRATDLKGNSRVYFPKKSLGFETEALLETLRVELVGMFRNYVSKNCTKGGQQKANLTKNQAQGLKSLKTRVKNGEVVIVPTDKSGNLAIMSRNSYMEAGMVHTAKDRLVGMEEVKMAQKELNGHISMLIKAFKIGSHWKHGYRCRETMMGESQSVCPLSLLFKDHKGWVAGGGSKPPTRPVAGGHLGINLHISEIVSEILDPVVELVMNGREVISTEDLLGKIEILNELMSDWTPGRYWAGMKEDDMVACRTCVGDDKGEYTGDNIELCVCDQADQEDGIDEEGRIVVTMNYMRWVRRQAWEKRVGWDETDITRTFKSTEVLHEDLQDQSVPMVIVGSDVVQLYPNLDIDKVVEVVEREVMVTKLEWSDVDYLEASRYVALNWSGEKCRNSGLRRVLPTRRGKTGCRPGLRGAGPQGGERGDTEQWIFPNVKLTKFEKRLLVGTVVKIATEAMFKNHYYGFGGKIFHQETGGPIGLRGTCSIARLVMQVFDVKWEGILHRVGLQMWLYGRYMDDGRSFMQPVKKGWKWQGGELLYSKKWELEDMRGAVTPEQKTSSILLESMQGVETYLKFTVETPEDFDGWLPTLDTNLRVEGNNQVSYMFYEKPTCTNTVIRKESALSENQKVQILAQELIRRLFNTKEGLTREYRAEIINKYTQKLINSGYAIEQTRKIILAGVKGYYGKVRRRRRERGIWRVHFTAQESGGSRWRKKLLSKTTWYKGTHKGKKVAEMNTKGLRKGEERMSLQRGGEDLKTRAVLFVPQTPMGELAKQAKEVLERMGQMMGFKLKVVERAGVSLQNQFNQSSLWRGLPCERLECIPCAQGGEEVPECTRTSVVYENICLTCNPKAASKGELVEQRADIPSLYVGESSRSLQERIVEHWSSYRRKDEGSHIRKHQDQHHPGQEPRFIVKSVSYHRSALSRQVREAVRIRRRGGESSILNSKSEFNRSYIPRLVVDKDGEEEIEKARLKDKDRLMRELDLEEDEWRKQKCGDRDREMRKRTLPPVREDEDEYVWGRRKKKRKIKHEILGENWGMDEEDVKKRGDSNDSTGVRGTGLCEGGERVRTIEDQGRTLEEEELSVKEGRTVMDSEMVVNNAEKRVRSEDGPSSAMVRSKKRGRHRNTRLDSSSNNKYQCITEYFTPIKSRRMSEGLEVLKSGDMVGQEESTQQDERAEVGCETPGKTSGEDPGSCVVRPLALGKRMGDMGLKVEMSSQETPRWIREGEEGVQVETYDEFGEDEEWTEVAISFIEMSGCETPGKTRGEDYSSSEARPGMMKGLQTYEAALVGGGGDIGLQEERTGGRGGYETPGRTRGEDPNSYEARPEMMNGRQPHKAVLGGGDIGLNVEMSGGGTPGWIREGEGGIQEATYEEFDDDEEWKEVAISFIEMSGCETPGRTRGGETGLNKINKTKTELVNGFQRGKADQGGGAREVTCKDEWRWDP